MKFPNNDMLVRIAEADACAAAVEYLNKNPGHEHLVAEALLLDHYVARPLGDIPAGYYTDDAEMSVGNTLVLLNRDAPYRKEDFVRSYLREFEYGGRRRGYAQGFTAFCAL